LSSPVTSDTKAMIAGVSRSSLIASTKRFSYASTDPPPCGSPDQLAMSRRQRSSVRSAAVRPSNVKFICAR
jgi:hypothetical protein